MTSNEWLIYARKYLKNLGISSANIDSLLILEFVLKQDRTQILTNPDLILDEDKLSRLKNYLERRSNFEPVAYITGEKEFYGRKFKVNKNVLVPRFESEAFINLLKEIEITKPLIADIGTGCGALAITAKLEIPKSKIVLTDISKLALIVASENIEKYKVNAGLFQNNLLNDFTFKPDIILANLPYVPNRYFINADAGYEPKLAIFGGTEGLELYIKFWNQVGKLNDKPRFILCESLEVQHASLKKLANKAGYKVIKTDCLVQLFVLAT